MAFQRSNSTQSARPTCMAVFNWANARPMCQTAAPFGSSAQVSEAVLPIHKHPSARPHPATLKPRCVRLTSTRLFSGGAVTRKRIAVSPQSPDRLRTRRSRRRSLILVRASVGAAAPSARCRCWVLCAFPGGHEVSIAFTSSSSCACVRTSRSDPTVRRRFFSVWEHGQPLSIRSRTRCESACVFKASRRGPVSE